MKLSAYKRVLSLTSLVAFLTGVVILPASRAEADPMREFILSCAYGTLAGTLVGVASLAFSDKPGDNLNRVARGASIGLYGGILLGAYIVNSVPGENDDDVPPGVTFNDPSSAPSNNLSDGPLGQQFGTLGRIHASRASVAPTAKLASTPILQIYPLMSERGIEGGAASLSLLSF